MDQLEELVASGRKIPFGSAVMLSQDAANDLIDRIRMGLPDEYARARDIIRARDASKFAV